MKTRPPLDDVIESIERSAGTQAKEARGDYEATMKEVRKTYEAARRAAETKERERLKEIERWRVKSIAAVDPSRPISLSDIASVKRETKAGVSISLPRVSCLEKQA